MLRLTAILFFTLSTAICSAQSVCEQLAQLKKECYGFKPSELTEAQKQDKSAQLDKFWNFAKANKTTVVECLRDLIVAEKDDSYFCFDASSLLLQLDEKQQYTDAVLAGLQKCDLKDLVLEPYLQIAFYLGKKGKDVSSLAEKLISYPNARVFLTIHVITLSAIDASLFLYNTMPVTKAEANLIATISNGNATAKHNAAVVLNILSTARGDSVLDKLMATNQLADSTIKFIKKDRNDFTIKKDCDKNIARDEILGKLNATDGYGFAGSEDLICNACKNLDARDAELVRSARERSTNGLSDEALHEYFALTSILITIRHR